MAALTEIGEHVFASAITESGERAFTDVTEIGKRVIGGVLNVQPTGVASGEVFGSPVVSLVDQTVSPTGIASAQAFGTAVVTADQPIVPAGIASAEAFGTAVLSLIEVGPGSIAEAIVVMDVMPEAATSIGESLMLLTEIQDVAPSGRRQPVKHAVGTAKVTWEEP